MGTACSQSDVNDEHQLVKGSITDPTEYLHNELVTFLTNSPEMRKTARQAMKQAAYAGTGVLIGGLAMGPIGGLFGGLCGSCLGYSRVDHYKSAVSQIGKLKPEQRRRLLKEVGTILLAAGATAPELLTAATFRTALISLAAQEPVRNAIWKACFDSTKPKDDIK